MTSWLRLLPFYASADRLYRLDTVGMSTRFNSKSTMGSEVIPRSVCAIWWVSGLIVRRVKVKKDAKPTSGRSDASRANG